MSTKVEMDKLFYVQDELFSPTRLIDPSGKSKEIFSYDEFGVPLSPEKHNINYRDFGNVLGFTGYQFEEVSELWFAQARYYDSNAGRFISEDILHGIIEYPLSLNRYFYCLSSPLNYVDFDGKSVYAIGVAGSASAGVRGAVTMALVWDDHGNVGLMSTASAGGGFVGVSISSVFEYAWADKITDLRGASTEVGAGISWEFIGGGVDFSTFDGGHSISVSGGLSIGTPIDIHGQTSWTFIETNPYRILSIFSLISGHGTLSAIFSNLAMLFPNAKMNVKTLFDEMKKIIPNVMEKISPYK